MTCSLACLSFAAAVLTAAVPESVYDEAKAHFSEKELVDLTYLAATINAWNRLAIALRSVPGRYRAAVTSSSPR